MATNIVGIERKNENSSAAARDIPATWPAAMVHIEREVPGKTAERICAAPIQIACGSAMPSMRSIRGWRQSASTTHMATPPMSSASAITVMLSRFLPITLVSRNDGNAVTTNAIITRLSGCVSTVRSPFSPWGKVLTNFAIRSRKKTGSARIAPSWMTMVYIFQKPLSRSMPSSDSAMRRCAVEETGRNSVSPSTMPRITESR